jgi:hypothetical protein
MISEERGRRLEMTSEGLSSESLKIGYCNMKCWAMSQMGLGCVITGVVGPGGPAGQIGLPQAASAAISGLVPTMFMARVRL